MLKFIYSYEKEKEILHLPNFKYPLSDLFQEWVNSADASEYLNTSKLCSTYTRMWEEAEPRFLEALANFLDLGVASLPNFEVTAYLSRIPHYPFNFKEGNRWFAVPAYNLPQQVLRVVVHELTHLYTFILFQKELSQFDKVMIDNIKEVSATIAVCTYFQSFLEGAKENFHERNREFADYVTGRIKDPQNPKFKEFLATADEFVKKT